MGHLMNKVAAHRKSGMIVGCVCSIRAITALMTFIDPRCGASSSWNHRGENGVLSSAVISLPVDRVALIHCDAAQHSSKTPKGLQSWTRCIHKRRPFGGEKGIRTPGTVSGTAGYQPAAINHSAISADEPPVRPFSTDAEVLTHFTPSVFSHDS